MSQPTAPERPAERLAPLDALRGLAALGVSVFSHFQHFGGNRATYPYNQCVVTHWIYENAWLFVDLFFLLSGVVLTYKYLEPIAKRKIEGREFFFLRMSRLYPLHVATVFVCAGVEWFLMARHEPTVIYDHNDIYNFALQLTYLGTFFEHGWSFNEPSWSVAGEILVYLLFYLYARRYRANYLVIALVTTAIGIGIQQPAWTLPLLNSNLGRALVGFFLGSAGFLFMRELDARGWGRRFGYLCLAAFSAICVLASFIGYKALISTNPLPNVLSVFPLLIFASLRVPPLAKLLSLRPLTFLGDISYAVYLIHVPLQMLTLAITRALKIELPTESPGLLFAFGAVLVAAATGVHYGFERPVRRRLRDLTTPPATAPASAP
jgi:peptidoglycan/LPS O-acetylase OafA/YrhL